MKQQIGLHLTISLSYANFHCVRLLLLLLLPLLLPLLLEQLRLLLRSALRRGLLFPFFRFGFYIWSILMATLEILPLFPFIGSHCHCGGNRFRVVIAIGCLSPLRRPLCHPTIHEEVSTRIFP